MSLIPHKKSGRLPLFLAPAFLAVFFLNVQSMPDIALDIGYGLSKPITGNLGEYFLAGLVTGIRFDFTYYDSIVFEFGLGYVQRGGKDKVMAVDNTYQTIDDGWSVFRFDYVRIPALFKFRYAHAKFIRPSFLIGPRLDLKVNYKYQLNLKKGLNELVAYGICWPAESALNPVVLGATMGMELEPFFMHHFGSTIRISGDIDITSYSQFEYNCKIAFDITAGFVYKHLK
jgi:hypothetical protein